MSLSVLLIHKVGIVRAYQLDAVFVSQFNEYLVSFLLQGERLTVGTDGRVFHLMALKFQIVVVAKHPVIPLDSLAGTSNVTIQNLLGHLAGDTCRADNESFVKLLQVLTVCTGAHIIAIHPRTAYQLNEVLIAFIVLGQHDEVVATLVLLAAA